MITGLVIDRGCRSKGSGNTLKVREVDNFGRGRKIALLTRFSSAPARDKVILMAICLPGIQVFAYGVKILGFYFYCKMLVF